MTLAVILFLVGLTGSAFFSGSETGLYRVSRTRLVLDGLAGSWAGRGLIWLLNHPAIFVATTLVGNNLANYATSAAIVLGVAAWIDGGPAIGQHGAAELPGAGEHEGIDLAATVLLTPVVFIFGELLPKSLFYQAPYRMLSAVRGLVIAAAVLLSPIASLLALLGQLLQKMTGQTPFRVQLTMGRGDFDRLLRAGQESGLLAAGQRDLAQALFDQGGQRAIGFGVRPDRLAVIDRRADVSRARAAARRANHPIVLVRRGKKIVGYHRYGELVRRKKLPPPRDVINADADARHLDVLLRLYAAHSDVAILSDEAGRWVGVVTRRQLVEPLL